MRMELMNGDSLEVFAHYHVCILYNPHILPLSRLIVTALYVLYSLVYIVYVGAIEMDRTRIQPKEISSAADKI